MCSRAVARELRRTPAEVTKLCQISGLDRHTDLSARTDIKRLSGDVANRRASGFPVIIAEWPRNGREIVRIALERFKDRYTIDIRVWWRDPTGIFKPGRDGLKLAISHTPKLAEGFDKARQRAEAFGLVSQSRRSRVAARPSDSTGNGQHLDGWCGRFE
jgi:hypothetical protein